MTDHPCKVCGAPAAVWTRKLKEGEPAVQTLPGIRPGTTYQVKWATWEYAGPAEYFCAAHAPELDPLEGVKDPEEKAWLTCWAKARGAWPV